MKRRNDELQVNPSIPRNIMLLTSQRDLHLSSGFAPDLTPIPTGPSASWQSIEDELWNNNNPERMKYWLNYFFSVEDRCDKDQFLMPFSFPRKDREDLYTLANKHKDILKNTSKSFLLMHRGKYVDDLVIGEQYKTFLPKETWIWMFTEGLHFRKHVLEKAKSNPLFLNFYLEHTNIKLCELNELLRDVKYDDYRLGKTSLTITPKAWVEYLNQLPEQTRLAFVMSKHPHNQNLTWRQIPKLWNFTYQDANKILERRSRFLAFKTRLTAEPEIASESLSHQNQPLDRYLEEKNIPFSSTDFLAMRGEEIKRDDFLRVNCDHYSFNDFTKIIEPEVNQQNVTNINGILASFFNVLMKNPYPLLSAVDWRDEPGARCEHSHPAALMVKLSATSETFNEVVRCARFAKEGLAANASQQLAKENVGVVVLEGEQGKRWYNVSQQEFVITDGGSASQSAVPSENYQALINSAKLSMQAGNFACAARDYCIALAIQQMPSILEETFHMIISHRITALHSTIALRLGSYIDGLFTHLNNMSLTTEKKIKLLKEALLFLGYLKSVQPDFEQNMSLRYFDNLQRFMTELISSQNFTAEDVSNVLEITEGLAAISSNPTKIKLYLLSARIGNSESYKGFLKVQLNKICESKYNFDKMEVERILLESFVRSPQKLCKIVNQFVWPWTDNQDVELQQFMLKLPMPIANIKDITRKVIDFSAYIEEEEERQKYLATLFDLLSIIYVKKADANDEGLARVIYYHALSEPECGDLRERLIIGLLKKTKSEVVRFILTDEEDKFCKQLLKDPIKSELADKKNIQAVYRGSLIRMLEEDNILAFVRLGQLGIKIDGVDKIGKPLLLPFLLSNSGQLKEMNANVSSLIGLMSPECADKVMEGMIQKNTCINQYINQNVQSMYIKVLSRLNPTQRWGRINQLLNKCYQNDDYLLINSLINNTSVNLRSYIDIHWLVSELRTLSVKKEYEKRDRLLQFSKQLTGNDDFCLSGLEASLYYQLKRDEPVLHVFQKQTGRQYAWLIQQFVAEMDFRALQRCAQMNFNLDLTEDNSKVPSLLPLFQNCKAKQEHSLLLLAQMLPGLLISKLYYASIEAQFSLEKQLFILDLVSEKETKGKYFNDLMKRGLEEGRFDFILKILSERVEWIKPDTVQFLWKMIEDPSFKLREVGQKEKILAILLHIFLSKESVIDVLKRSSIKQVLILEATSRSNLDSYSRTINLLLQYIGEDPIENRNMRMRAALSMFSQTYRERKGRPYWYTQDNVEPQEQLNHLFKTACRSKNDDVAGILQNFGWFTQQGKLTSTAPIGEEIFEKDDDLSPPSKPGASCWS